MDCTRRGPADDPARLLLQKKLAVLANRAAHESTLRNAVLVESVQGLEDIKLMQAENRFYSSGTAISVLPESQGYARVS